MTFNVEQMKSTITRKGGLAYANQWRVILPTITTSAMTATDLDVTCRSVSLPGRQILTQERIIGMKPKKNAYAYGAEDVSMTFIVMADQGIKRYFDDWMASIINFGTQGLTYKDFYVSDITINQLKKPQVEKVDYSPNDVAYSCRLIRAFPTTVNALELNNEQGNLLELNVQFSYDDWQPLV